MSPQARLPPTTSLSMTAELGLLAASAAAQEDASAKSASADSATDSADDTASVASATSTNADTDGASARAAPSAPASSEATAAPAPTVPPVVARVSPLAPAATAAAAGAPRPRAAPTPTVSFAPLPKAAAGPDSGSALATAKTAKAPQPPANRVGSGNGGGGGGKDKERRAEPPKGDRASRGTARAAGARRRAPPSRTREDGNGDDAGDEDASEEIRCICDFSDDDGYTIQCEKCLTWQHILCIGFTKATIPDNYFCPTCEPRPVDRKAANEVQRARRARSNRSRANRGGSPRSRASSNAGDDDDSDGNGPVDPGVETPAAVRGRNGSRDQDAGPPITKTAPSFAAEGAGAGPNGEAVRDDQARPKPMSREEKKFQQLLESFRRMEEGNNRKRARPTASAEGVDGAANGAAAAATPGSSSAGGSGAGTGASGAKKRKPADGPSSGAMARSGSGSSTTLGSGKRSRSTSPHAHDSTGPGQLARRPSTASAAAGFGPTAAGNTASGGGAHHGRDAVVRPARPLLSRVRIDDDAPFQLGGLDGSTSPSATSPGGGALLQFAAGNGSAAWWNGARSPSGTAAGGASPAGTSPQLPRGKKLWARTFAVDGTDGTPTSPGVPLSPSGNGAPLFGGSVAGGGSDAMLPLKKKHVSFDLGLADGAEAANEGPARALGSPMLTDTAPPETTSVNPSAALPSTSPRQPAKPLLPALKDEFPDIVALVALADNLAAQPPAAPPSSGPPPSPLPALLGSASPTLASAEPYGRVASAPGAAAGSGALPPLRRPTPPQPFGVSLVVAATGLAPTPPVLLSEVKAEPWVPPARAARPFNAADLFAPPPALQPPAAPMALQVPVPAAPPVAPSPSTAATAPPVPSAASLAPSPAAAEEPASASKTKVSLADYRNKKRTNTVGSSEPAVPAPVADALPAGEPISPPTLPVRPVEAAETARDYFSMAATAAEPASPVNPTLKAPAVEVPTFETISPNSSPRLVPKSPWAPAASGAC